MLCFCFLFYLFPKGNSLCLTETAVVHKCRFKIDAGLSYVEMLLCSARFICKVLSAAMSIQTFKLGYVAVYRRITLGI